MARRTIYEVAPDQNAWVVKKQGAERASTRHDTKKDAISRGREIAQNAGLSQLIIKRADGTIEEERTYPRSSDPRATAG